MKRRLLAFALSCAAGLAHADAFEDATAAWPHGDHETTHALVLPLAEQGHAGAQAQFALLYDKGQGVAQDRGQAIASYRKAAEQGQLEAASNLELLQNEVAGTGPSPR